MPRIREQHYPTKLISLGLGQSSPAICSRLIHLTPKTLFSPKAKDLVVALEKRTVSYLSVSARIWVIDPFSQMKRGYNTILDDADSANRNNFSHLRVLHDALRETFLKVTKKTKCKLLNDLNGTEASFRRAMISNNCQLSIVLKRELWVV